MTREEKIRKIALSSPHTLEEIKDLCAGHGDWYVDKLYMVAVKDEEDQMLEAIANI